MTVFPVTLAASEMIRYLFTTILICRSFFAPAQDAYVPEVGDLLFQDLDCGPYCKSIERVTQGVYGANFSHIGILVLDSGQAVVYEAVSRGVVATPLQEFLSRNINEDGRPKVIVGRLKDNYRFLIPHAIEQANQLLGSAYDDTYVDGDDRYYCSELVYEVFKRANNEAPFFPLAPMTYIDPDTGQTFPIWKDYFTRRNTTVPEGVPGINPGAISRSPYIKIVYKYYVPKEKPDTENRPG